MNKRMSFFTGCVLAGLAIGLDPSAFAAANAWNGDAGDLKWTTPGNWTNGAPGGADDVVFDNTSATGAIGPDGASNNVVDANTHVRTLTCRQTNGLFHTTFIPEGVTLTLGTNLTGNAVALFVGTAVDSGAAGSNYTTIHGPGTLAFSNAYGVLRVRQGAGASGSHRATLDLSGLNTLDGQMLKLVVADDGANNAVQNYPAGTLLLAKTNYVVCSEASQGGAILVGQTDQNNGQPSLIRLGQVNVFRADSGMKIGSRKSTARVDFNDGLASPTAVFRNKLGTGAMSYWGIGDNSAQGGGSGVNHLGTLDLTAGTVDAQVGAVFVGRSYNGTNGVASSTGVLRFASGTIAVSGAMEVGYQNTGGQGSALGTVFVGAPGQLLVGGHLRLASKLGGTGAAAGTLNVAGGAVGVAGDLLDGGGVSAVTLTNGTLSVAGSLGGETNPVDTLLLTNSTLQINVAGATPVWLTALGTGGSTNLITIMQTPALSSFPTQLVLVKYAGAIGGAGYNFGLGNRTNFPGYLVNNSGNSSIDLVLTANPSGAGITWVGSVNSNWDANATTNWKDDGGNPTVFFQADSVTFNDTASNATVSLVGSLAPVAVAVSNAALNYTFAGAGRFTGSGGLTKQGAGSLTIANSGANDFFGPIALDGGALIFDRGDSFVVANALSGAGALVKRGPGTMTLSGASAGYTGHAGIEGGTLQVGGGGTAGQLQGNITNHGALAFSRSDAATNASAISGAGSVTKLSANDFALAGASSYTGPTLVGAGILTILNGLALGNSSTVTVNNSSTLRLDGGVAVSGRPLVLVNNGIDSQGALQGINGTNEWAGPITIGANGVRVGTVGDSTLVLSGVVDSGANNYGLAVRTLAATGVVVLRGSNTWLGSSQAIVGTLRLAGGDNRLPTAASLVIGNAANNTSATLDLGGQNQQVAGLWTLGTTMPVAVTNSSASLSVLSLTFDAATYTNRASINGPIALTKAGTGTQILSGASTYSGDTTISAGTLRLGASNILPDGAGKGDVTVNGTLELSGFSDAINGLNGSGSVIDSTGTGTYTFALGGGDASGSFGGTIGNALGTLGLTKNGTGTQILSGVNTYNGPTVINGGTLAIAAGGSIDNSTGMTISAGGVLDVSGVGGYLVGPGRTLNAGRPSAFAADVVGNLTNLSSVTIGGAAQAGTLTVSGGLSLEGGSLAYDLANVTTAGGGVNDLIAIAGPLNLSGTTTINPSFLQGVPATGIYTLVSGGTSVAGNEANLSLNWPVGTIRSSAALDTTSTPGSVLMQVSGPAASLLWVGSDAGRWNVNLSLNWDNGGSSDSFYNYDAVRFDDSSPAGAVGVEEPVTPSVTVISNDTQAYTFSGAGRIGGGGAVVKAGPGTATLSLTNDYTGATLVTGGVLKLGHLLALGATNGGTFVSGAGTLDLNDLQVLGDETVTIAGAGAGGQGALVNNIATFTSTRGLRFLTLSGDATVGGLGRFDVKNTPTILGNGYALTKVGTNMVNLDGAGDCGFGDIFVDDGALQVQGNTTLGSLSNAMTIAAAGTFASFASTVTNLKPLAVNGGRILVRNASLNLGGPMTLSGFATIQVDATAIGLRGPIGGTGGFAKTGAGALNMYSASNTWGGGALLSAGVVNVFASEALVGNVTNDTAVAFRPASNETLTCSANLTGTGTISHTVADATTVLTGTSDIGGGITAGGGELRVGGGSLAGSAIVTGAMLRVASGAAFHAGSLVLGLNAVASTNLAEAGATETVGAGPAQDLIVGFRSINTSIGPRGVLDVSALDSFSANVGNFLVGCSTQNTAVAPAGGTIWLASNNTIVATNILIGNVDGGGGYANGWINVVTLGAGSNVIQTPRMTVGGLKMSGHLLLPAGGTLVMNNGAAPADLYVGANNIGTSASTTNLVDLAGGAFVANLNNLVVAEKFKGPSANSLNGSVAASLLLGSNAANSVAAGSVTVTHVADSLAGGNGVGILTIGGGAFFVTNNITLCSYTGPNGAAQATLNLNGGTVSVAGDLVDGSSSTAALSTVVVDGATLDLQPAGDAVAGAIGSATEPIDSLQLLSGTLRNVAQINGGGTVVKDGPGTLVLDGATAYTGPTVVSNGTLLVHCSLGAAGVTVEAGGTLGGDGTLGGSAVINPGGTLAPGASIGDLEVMDTLTLLGHTVMESAKAGGVVSNDRVYNLFTVNFGGTLTVTATGQALAAGDSLTLFSAAFYNGWFAGVTLPTLPDDLAWDTNKLRTTGILDVYSFSFSTQHLAAVKNTPATLPVATLLAKASSTRGGPLVLASVSATSAMGGSVSNDGATIFYTPALNYVGPDMFTGVISDGQGEIAAPVHVTVSDTAAPTGGAVQGMRVTAGQLFLTYTGAAGTVYILQAATNLVPAPAVTWVPLETNTAPLSGAITSSVSTATNRVRYYRTVVP